MTTKIKVIRDVVEEIELANEPYIQTPEEEKIRHEWWDKLEQVTLWRGVDEYGGKWFRICKYDLKANPPKRFILDSTCGWREYQVTSNFDTTCVFREEK